MSTERGEGQPGGDPGAGQPGDRPGAGQPGDRPGEEKPGDGPGEGQPGEGGRRPELIAETTAEVRAQQIAYDRFHDAVAGYLGINRTDLRCLDILDLAGRQTAGELAAAMGLSTGAVTAMLDRLEKTGYVRRLRDPGDRRRVLVEPAELARERGWEVYRPFEEATVPMFARFTDEQLAVVRDFLRIGNDFYDVQTARIEELARGADRTPRP
jgi:DNA-binding MarR family transcriptional regulator